MPTPAAPPEKPPSGEPWRDALLLPATYAHPIREVQLVETHISVVALTGDFPYKLKKAVDYGFVDFSTLELRRKYCEAELSLNQRTAPQLYPDVVPLVRHADGYRFDAGGDNGPRIGDGTKGRNFPNVIGPHLDDGYLV